MNLNYPFKRGWKPVPESGRLRQLFEEVYAYAKSIRIVPINAERPLFFTYRSTRKLGECFYAAREGKLYASILLNKGMAQLSDDRIRKTIAHEIAHMCTAWDHHGEKWHRVANELGKHWGYSIEQYSAEEEVVSMLRSMERPYRYEVYCPVCAFSIKLKSRSLSVREPQQWLCPIHRTPLCSRELSAAEKNI